jgi:hypothetical protein
MEHICRFWRTPPGKGSVLGATQTVESVHLDILAAAADPAPMDRDKERSYSVLDAQKANW